MKLLTFISLLFIHVQTVNFPRMGQECNLDSDCYDSFEYCSSSTSLCNHKDVFPLLPIEYLGCLAVFIMVIVGCLSGGGSAGTVIPISLYFFGFNYKNAINLSLAAIATSGVVRYLMNFNKPHPLKKGKGLLIDYAVPIIMMPSIVIGVSIGAIIY